MLDPISSVGVPSIAVYLILREVFAFINRRRNGQAGCPTDLQRKHADMLSRHDQAIAGVFKNVERIDGRLDRIERHILKAQD